MKVEWHRKRECETHKVSKQSRPGAAHLPGYSPTVSDFNILTFNKVRYLYNQTNKIFGMFSVMVWLLLSFVFWNEWIRHAWGRFLRSWAAWDWCNRNFTFASLFNILHPTWTGCQTWLHYFWTRSQRNFFVVVVQEKSGIKTTFPELKHPADYHLILWLHGDQLRKNKHPLPIVWIWYVTQ